MGSYIDGTDQRLAAQYRPDEKSLECFDTVEGRAREVMLLEFVSKLEHQPEDINFIRAVAFHNWLQTADGKTELYDMVVKMRKELH